jgi:hypothetical protein
VGSSITIHSLTQEAKDARIIRTSKDRISAIHLDDYFRTYRLVSAYAAYLDRFPIATGGKAPYDLVARKRGDDPWSIVEKSPLHSSTLERGF